MKIACKSITILYMVALAGVSVSPGSPESDAVALKQILHNLAHIPAYTILIYLLYFSFSPLTLPKKILSVFIAFIFGVALEYIQASVPFRYASGSDVLLNGAGILIGHFLFTKNIFRRRI